MNTRVNSQQEIIHNMGTETWWYGQRIHGWSGLWTGRLYPLVPEERFCRLWIFRGKHLFVRSLWYSDDTSTPRNNQTASCSPDDYIQPCCAACSKCSLRGDLEQACGISIQTSYSQRNSRISGHVKLGRKRNRDSTTQNRLRPEHLQRHSCKTIRCVLRVRHKQLHPNDPDSCSDIDDDWDDDDSTALRKRVLDKWSERKYGVNLQDGANNVMIVPWEVIFVKFP